ncbi:MAG TPA: acyl-CoA desaturase [Phycisphaerales bacterium]|nr:acyl-CoA desaturase [Phycisphaerales bacterium]
MTTIEPHTDGADAPLPLSIRLTNLTVILVPFAALILGIAYAWGWGIGWTELALLVGMYLLTGLGVTVGYHRLFTHKSFKTGKVITALLGVLGSMSVEGPILRWVAFHRAHHQHSDDELDPHSPHGHGGGVLGVLRGFWNAHCGWLLTHPNNGLDRYVVDLKQDRLVKAISDLFPLWMVVSLLLPGAIGGLITLSWSGAALGMLWGGLVRILLVHHITWSVNSVCHLWGTRPYESHDESRNNPIVGVLAFGEGWHNNHHAFPTSARHGLAWWQVDASYAVIWTLARLGLAWDVRIPAPERLAAKRR